MITHRIKSITPKKQQAIGPWDEKCPTLEYYQNLSKSSTLSPVKNREDKSIKASLIGSPKKNNFKIRKRNASIVNNFCSLLPVQVTKKQSMDSTNVSDDLIQQQVNIGDISPTKQQSKRYRISTRYGSQLLYFSQKEKEQKIGDRLKKWKMKTIDYQPDQSYNFVIKRKHKN